MEVHVGRNDITITQHLCRPHHMWHPRDPRCHAGVGIITVFCLLLHSVDCSLTQHLLQIFMPDGRHVHLLLICGSIKQSLKTLLLTILLSLHPHRSTQQTRPTRQTAKDDGSVYQLPKRNGHAKKGLFAVRNFKLIFSLIVLFRLNSNNIRLTNFFKLHVKHIRPKKTKYASKDVNK
jgi:hypothetical protein